MSGRADLLSSAWDTLHFHVRFPLPLAGERVRVKGCVGMRNVPMVNSREAFSPHPGPLPLGGDEGESLHVTAGLFPTISLIPAPHQ